MNYFKTNICAFNFINLLLKFNEMYSNVRLIIKQVFIIIMFIMLLAISGCAAQKHHKAVPCPCEKRK